MQIHFLSDILFAVASLDLKVPKLYLEYLGWGSLSKYGTFKQCLIISKKISKYRKSFLYLFPILNTLTVLQRRNKHNRT